MFGPLLYVSVTSAFDTRAAITSIALLILVGSVLLRWVDVAAGRSTGRGQRTRGCAGAAEQLVTND